MAPRYSQKTIFNMASVRHVEFVMTSSYCIRKLHFMFPTLCQIRLRIFRNTLSRFSILAWINCLFWA